VDPIAFSIFQHEIHQFPGVSATAVPAASFETSPAPLRCRASPNRWHLQSHRVPWKWAKLLGAVGKRADSYDSYEELAHHLLQSMHKIGLKHAMSNE